MNPQFNQGWGVFAPVPREKSRLYYRYYYNEQWSEVISIDEEMEKIPNIFSERIALKSAHYLGYEARENTIINEDGTKDYRVVMASSYYKRAGYTCLQNLKITKDIRPDSMQIILERDLSAKSGNQSKKTITDKFGIESIK